MLSHPFVRRFAFAVLTLAAVPSALADGRPLTFTELMQFQQIRQPSIAEDGRFVAYALEKDRGDGEAVVRAVDGEAEHRVERGAKPMISADSRWAVAAVEPPLAEREAAEAKKSKDKPARGLAIVDLATGTQELVERVESFAFSDDGRWLAYRHGEEPGAEKAEGEEAEAGEGTPSEATPSEATPSEATPSEAAPSEAAPEEKQPGERKTEEEMSEEVMPEEEAMDEGGKPKQEPKLGTTLELRDLATGETTTIEHVTEYSFDEPSAHLAYVVSAPGGSGNGLYVRHLGDGETAALHQADAGHYAHLSWAREQSRLAFVAAVFGDDGEPGEAEVWTWDGEGEALVRAARDDAPKGFTVPAKNDLDWSRDGERLFFGFKPLDPEALASGAEGAEGAEGEESKESKESKEGEEEEKPFDPYDLEGLLEKRGVDVWHWNDPWINSNQKKRWERQEKDRTYRAVLHLESGRVVPLADPELPDVLPSDNPHVAVGLADVPYRKALTWDGSYVDLYTVRLTDGERRRVATRLAGGGRGGRGASLSPGGRFLTFYQDGHWHLHDVEGGTTRNVTAELGVPFANEDHDYPSDPPGYGQAEWLTDDSAALIYDKYDVWQVYTDARPPLRLTRGREQETVFRVEDVDPEETSIEPGASLLLKAYHDTEKHDAFHAAELGKAGTEALYATGRHRLQWIARAEGSGRYLFSRERYDEFPDLRVAEPNFESPRRLSDANPQIADFAWGEAELVEWRSLDGVALQGVLIKPGDYEEGRRYPVLVYYYRFFSQRLHEFNEPVVNHRPSFPMYASNGYAVFLPDIRFEVGQPGFSATKCLVPGVQKLIDMGIADPQAIGLHGHSWSGYQTAFVITQTDLFAAAVAGAPVSNMTSAYSGIRWGTGLARQFQYEKSQSRIGGSLWEYPERYIENSPVFYADRIETPLLIQFGDEDEAVPWYQGIELYLACRRLGKECIFLQYRGEPHHLKQYPNKVDYSIKMMEFFDHHLKGEPAPTWMSEGVPYRGE